MLVASHGNVEALCRPLLVGCVCVSLCLKLDDREAVRRRPPARLESLKATKMQSFSREEVDEKIRLASERRKVDPELHRYFSYLCSLV